MGKVPGELHSWLDHACEPTALAELIRSHVPVVVKGGPPLTAVVTKLVRDPSLVRARISDRCTRPSPRT